tara:strand:+ start:68 stop:406 length:339 start_codon:yes stop_codon:yes gene_type:complete
MSLGEKQRRFTLMIGKLIIFAYDNGYELTCGDFYRDPRVHGNHGEKQGYGSSKSVHKLRLAGDLNLFVKGEYITISTHPAWTVLHDYWRSLGGADAVPNDANHFSMEIWGCR